METKLFSVFHNKFLLVCIIVLSLIVHFYQINKIPASLYWDEVAVGYNAYSILHTGRDEYGNKFPILFESYHDLKMPVFVYLSTVSIAVLGLNELAIRFPSAFFGVIGVIFLYFLIKNLDFRDQNEKTYLALLSAFFLAISPWHIIFSRTGYEANIALTLLIIGFYFFYKGLRQSWYFLISAIFYVVACYCYRSSLIFVPFFVTFLTVHFFSDLKKIELKQLLFSIVFFIFLLLPLVSVLAKGGDTRFSQVSIFSNVSDKSIANNQKMIESGNALFAKLIFNRRMVYVNEALTGYFSHFRPDFLFVSGDGNLRHTVRGAGLLYLWQLPLLILGIPFLLKKNRKFTISMIVWLLISPVSASLALPVPHALRVMPMVVPLVVFSAAGLLSIFSLLKNTKIVYLFKLASFFVIFLSFITFLKLYYVHNTQISNSEWGDGYKQLVQRIGAISNKYDKVIISGHYWQPYMYALFYLRFDPALYQEHGTSVAFDKYIFGGTDWDKRVGRSELGNVDLRNYAGRAKNILVALSPQEYIAQQDKVKKIDEVKDSNGKVVFILAYLN
ncbi:MAG: glycosyltransferase family 39 protein [Candidatus Levybacteria bacterium]|nr:glycosyltransferase family 39 protein [Candidatus Levybacteria bacterium]